MKSKRTEEFIYRKPLMMRADARLWGFSFAGDFSGMIPEPNGTTAAVTNPEYIKLFGALGAGSLGVGVALVVLIPFLRKLITDKAEITPAEMETTTVVPVA